MEQGLQANFNRLHDYLCDMILEEQLKLGFEKETIRFYSPCASIGHVLQLEVRTLDAVMQALEGFADYAKDTLGEVKVSRCSDNRICFLIPAQGANYVHEYRNENPFLKELIGCFCRHGITLSDVQRVFYQFSSKVQCTHIGSDDFDDVLFFTDGTPDSYRYCVKFDAGHAFYHRFLKEDFEELFA